MLSPLALIAEVARSAQDPGRAAHDLGRAAHDGPDWNRYVLVCALLLVLLGFLAWGLRAIVSGTVRSGAARRSLQVIDVLPLGGKQRVCVVRCYDRTFALGVGDKEVGLIAEIDAEASMPKTIAPAPPAAFASMLARLSRRAPVHVEPVRVEPVRVERG